MVFPERIRQLEFAAINKMRTLVAQEDFEHTPRQRFCLAG